MICSSYAIARTVHTKSKLQLWRSLLVRIMEIVGCCAWLTSTQRGVFQQLFMWIALCWLELVRLSNVRTYPSSSMLPYLQSQLIVLLDVWLLLIYVRTMHLMESIHNLFGQIQQTSAWNSIMYVMCEFVGLFPSSLLCTQRVIRAQRILYLQLSKPNQMLTLLKHNLGYGWWMVV